MIVFNLIIGLIFVIVYMLSFSYWHAHQSLKWYHKLIIPVIMICLVMIMCGNNLSLILLPCTTMLLISIIKNALYIKSFEQYGLYQLDRLINAKPDEYIINIVKFSDFENFEKAIKYYYPNYTISRRDKMFRDGMDVNSKRIKNKNIEVITKYCDWDDRIINPYQPIKIPNRIEKYNQIKQFITRNGD